VKIFDILVIVVIFIAFLSVIGSLIFSSTNFAYADDTFSSAKNHAVPHNFSLSQSSPQVLQSVTNCTIALSSSNYTDYVSAGFLQLDDNVSWNGVDLCVGYTYDQGRVSGASALLLGLITLLLVLGLIVMIKKQYGFGRK